MALRTGWIIIRRTQWTASSVEQVDSAEDRNLGGPFCRYVGAAGDADGRYRHCRGT
jgi:hypothetical protein